MTRYYIAKKHYGRNKSACKTSGTKTIYLNEVTCIKCLKSMFKKQPDGISFDMIQNRIEVLNK